MKLEVQLCGVFVLSADLKGDVVGHKKDKLVCFDNQLGEAHDGEEDEYSSSRCSEKQALASIVEVIVE